jgi:hypothetical protein
MNPLQNGKFQLAVFSVQLATLKTKNYADIGN